MATTLPPHRKPTFLSHFFKRTTDPGALVAGPIQGELLGVQQLRARAREIARSQRSSLRSKARRQTPLLARLSETRTVLQSAHQRLTQAVEREMDVGPAGEWLLDNYHVLQEHIREVHESLPGGFYRQLPELVGGPLIGYPRVYQLAITLISHTEGRVDLENIHEFVSAFQEVAPLAIGELWSIPAMLRLGLIENLRRMTLRTVQRLDEVEMADQWANRIQEASKEGALTLNQVVDDFISHRPALTAIFVSRFLQRLRLEPGATPSLVWLEHWIGDEGLNAEEAAARATQRLGLTRIMVANSITSLRAIARADWRTFIEAQSRMEAVLRQDPTGDYPRMTFATRDRYRHIVERIARRSGIGEELVAALAVDLANSAGTRNGVNLREHHVGFYLVDNGLGQLEERTRYRLKPMEAIHRTVLHHPNVVFVGGIVSATAAALAALVMLAGPMADHYLVPILLVGLLPAAELAVNAVNQLVTAFLPPRTLPKLDFHEYGIPPECRTVVVVPTLFENVDGVREALENIEAQFLANREANIHFAVLSDFTDAIAEVSDSDAAIVAAATEGVRALNARYPRPEEDQFYLFHRPRKWNPKEGVWMGWERKRGKLSQFNRFLRGGAANAFSTIVGNTQALRQVRYVITLDSDTVLPPDAAPLLIGTLAHPLNAAVVDPEHKTVVNGYGIIQPRVGVSLPSANRSRFASIHSGHPGVDPYTIAVSDVYQDLYGEGSYTGKGIYEVDTFEQATRGRFPENTLLSHDLIEGNYARAGLATDINVYDDYPTTYLAYTRRKHRWIRGDWQLLPWLRSTVPSPDGPEPNRLSLLSRWKIVDNMRRSTVEIAQLVFLIAGWSFLPSSYLRWTLLGLAAIAGPWIIATLIAMLRPPFDKSWRAYYAAVARDALTSARQLGLAIAFLPHQAWVSADAIIRTFWRLLVSHQHLLEWRTASQVAQSSQLAREVWREMLPAVLLSMAGLAIAVSIQFIFRGNGTNAGPAGTWTFLVAVLPVVGLWLSSPSIAQSLSAPALPAERRLPQASRIIALRYALLHWRYFDRFANEGTHWLAPDNFQEGAAPVVAMRTSPTNIGLQLLATVSAAQLGFITPAGMVKRLERTFDTLDQMRRFRGHFYNWYDLRDLHVLAPEYISTVDSGNLAGHLLAFRQACLALTNEPVFDGRLWPVLDAVLVLITRRLVDLANLDDHSAASRKTLNHAQELVAGIHTLISRAPAAASVAAANARVSTALNGLLSALDKLALPPANGDSPAEWIRWSLDLLDSFGRQIEKAETTSASGRDGESRVHYPGFRAIGSGETAALVSRLELLADRAYAIVCGMQFAFLYDGERKLFSIGFQQDTHSLDPAYYDLLASEARLASFLAIAKNDVPVEHWFRLGRTLTRSRGNTALVSWSGSMFEYLMPALVMQSYPFTVLDQTNRSAVARQIAYGAERGVPWGVSESAYNLRDRHQTYQYRAFGVPDLALKRGLGRDLVIAPYASALAIMIDPSRALANLAALERRGALGPYGFRDALDYTRPDPDQRYAVVNTYMAHHIGMGLVALTNALSGRAWQRWFHDDPMVRSAELLLQERIPRRLLLQEVQTTRAEESLPDPEMGRPAVRQIAKADTPYPHIALLGLPPYTLMISHTGGGYSRYNDLAVTRWRADGTRDNTGQFCYIKNLGDNRVWSTTHQPVRATADWYRALLATDRVTFHRADGDIETRTEIAVVPDDAAEVRRVTVTNNGDQTREIELTSYGEIVLAPPDTDRAHPAFSNLFVQTEWHEHCSAITATRRPRSATEPVLWCTHVVDTVREQVGAVTCETDRARFVGRGRTPECPSAMENDGPLSGTTGAVLDPIFALRIRIRLEAGQSSTAAFTTLVAATRERAIELAGRYHDGHAAQRALDLAWTTTQVELRELNITPAESAVFQEIAGHLFHGHPALRASASELARNRGSYLLLWSLGLSGDWPILLATIDSVEGLPTLRQLFTAHHYWRRRGMMVDLVVLNVQPNSYQQELNDRITEALLASNDAGVNDRPGGVFIRRRDLLRPEELLMVRATARVHLPCDGRSLGKILDTLMEVENPEPAGVEPALAPPRMPGRNPAAAAARAIWRIWSDATTDARETASLTRPSRSVASSRASSTAIEGTLLFENGLGGMLPDGRYRIVPRGDHLPPAPWVNVIANPHGGFIVSERGTGCTWAENSLAYRLTPWANDPVSDPASEIIYLQDVETGALWSPTPAPFLHNLPYTVHHQAGRSTFEHEQDGIASHLSMGLADDETMVKLSTLELTNHGAATRRIVVTSFIEWTLGILREHTRHQVRTEFDAHLEAMFAQNTFDPYFAEWLSFATVSEPVIAYTGDRGEFLGRNGAVDDPDALRMRARLSGTIGAGLDPCSALQCTVELAPGETRSISFLLGAAVNENKAREAIARYRSASQSKEADNRTVQEWRQRLSVIRVATPEPSLDMMLNHWALYQALSCRMWGRTALYQSSGAFGFRDQLQDCAAFVYAEPALAREHILRSAGRQFVEGDVQHWWHPDTGRGVRTRFSDDLVWLPFIVDHYIKVTGDAAVLNEPVQFLTMRPLEPHEHELYDFPQVSNEQATLYEHCIRALKRATTVGSHGLPLIGSGDWNDGMNRVGIEGRGESVWLAWFLISTLRSFAEHARLQRDNEAAADLEQKAGAYTEAVEQHAWDGEWYRRAYFDDGTPLGSAGRAECRIDSIAQSWSVISGAGEPGRQTRAMQSLDEQLVRRDARLLMLLTPAFDKTPEDPGYIKGYLPGVRENGAQYTHAALWAVLATALEGNGDHALELFQMINPLTHTSTPADVARYKTEPYVVAADVYTAEGHLGRGGWTWYTGSASWMYRVGVEAILGFTKRGDTLEIRPCVPASWPEYRIDYRFGGTVYSIRVLEPGRIKDGLVQVMVDGAIVQGSVLPLADSGGRHEVIIRPDATKLDTPFAR
ncbi:MAG: glucoamylase family protein [Gemmatimonadota bacterium]